jgi:hypothetical protein
MSKKELIEKQEIQTVNPSENILAVISRAAADPGCDVEKMERLLDMQERVMNKAAEMESNQAFDRFQSDCPQLNKTKAIVVQGRARSHYCSYEEMMRTVRPIMKNHGFSDRFDTATDQDGQISSVTCTISHSAGHSWQSTFPVAPDTSGSKNAIQAIGSALSYGKRYAFAAAMGVVFKNEDDDGGPQTAQDLPEMQIGATSETDKSIVDAFFRNHEITEEWSGKAIKLITKGTVENWRDLPADRLAKFAAISNLEAIAAKVEEMKTQEGV